MSSTKTTLHFTANEKQAERPLDVAVTDLVIAGWTGRDASALEAHIKELEALGVTRPKSTPIFYRGAASLLTHNEVIEVVGNASSGEIEPVLVGTSDGLWLGIGSDHTDRKVEAIGVTISKQLCAKPLARGLWRFESVEDHWDELIIRSWITQNNERRLYQEGSLENMRHPNDLLTLYGGEQFALPQGTIMFCGTIAAHGDLSHADYFEMEIEDPVIQRKLNHKYHVVELPIEG